MTYSEASNVATENHEPGKVEIKAWVAIHQLISEFAYSIDIENGARTAEFFTEQGWYESDSRRSTGREAIRQAYERRAARGVRTSRHIFTNVRVERVRDSTYRGNSILLLFAEDGHPPLLPIPLLVADVVDEYVFDGNSALIRSRQLRSIFRSDSHDPVLPLGED